MIYLDNAATSWPKPEIVYQAMDRFLREKGGNPGHGSHSMAGAADETVNETRTIAARFLNSPDIDRIVFTLNCTDSINMGLKGLLKPGDHVIVSSLEHNSVIRPLSKLGRQGITITRVPISEKTGTVSPEDVEKAVGPKTRLILMNHASNVNGAVQPVAEIGRIARACGLIFMVDAAQGAGHVPIDVRAWNADLLVFSAHKGTMGPPGVGVLYIGERAILDTTREGGTGSSSESEEQPDRMPQRFESGTLNTVGIAGFGAGLKFIMEQGLEKIASHEDNLTGMLKEGLSKIPGVTLFSAGDESIQLPVISFNINGYQPGVAGAILDQTFDIKVRTGLHCAPDAHRSIRTFPSGTIRVSPGYFNTAEDIEITIDAVRKIARS